MDANDMNRRQLLREFDQYSDDEAARERLLEIADKCPVHRTLHSEVLVESRLKE